MTRWTLSLAAVAFAAAADAQPPAPPAAPRNFPPAPATVTANADGTLTVRRRATVPLARTEQYTTTVMTTETAIENGRQVTRQVPRTEAATRTVTVRVARTVETQQPAATLRNLRRLDGQPTDKKPGAEPMDLLVARGNTADPFHAQFFRPESLVAQLDVLLQPGGPPPAARGTRDNVAAAYGLARLAAKAEGPTRNADEAAVVVRVFRDAFLMETKSETVRGPDGADKRVEKTVMGPAATVEHQFVVQAGQPAAAPPRGYARLFRADGKPADATALTKETPVVVAGGELDPALAKFLKPDVLVVYVQPLPEPAAATKPAATPVVPVAPPRVAPTPPASPPPAPTPPTTADPAVAERQVLAGRWLLVGRRYLEAADAFRQAADAAPGEPMPLYYLAYAQHAAGHWSEAEETVRQAVAAERGGFAGPLGRDWERFQGPSRAWLSAARAR